MNSDGHHSPEQLSTAVPGGSVKSIHRAASTAMRYRALLINHIAAKIRRIIDRGSGLMVPMRRRSASCYNHNV